jgi:hypothetical protein
MNSAFRIIVRDSPLEGLSRFSLADLNAIADSLLVEMKPGVKAVFYGENPPSDISLPWQQTLADGITPVGMVQNFIAGKWR